MRTRLAVAAALTVALAACGTPEPGKDFAGNQVEPAATTQAETTTPETTTEDSAAQQPSSAPAVPTFKIGAAAVVHKEYPPASGLITVSSPKVWRKPSNAELGSKPKYGRFLRVTVSAASTTGVFGVNPFEFTIVDGEGTRYQMGEGSAMTEFADDSLSDADLNPGEKIKGTIVFDVPRGPLTLAYAPASQTLATWQLDVK